MTEEATEATSWPEIPETVEVADTVDLDVPDPAWVEGTGKRTCIAARRKDNARCTASALTEHVLCIAHAGRLDPREGGLALAEKRREARRKAEERVAARRLGTRAAINEVLADEQERLKQGLRLLVRDCSDTSLPVQLRHRAAQLVLPYVDQALGKPTERLEHTAPGALSDIQHMSTEQLEEVVASGRARRLQAVPEPADDAQTG